MEGGSLKAMSTLNLRSVFIGILATVTMDILTVTSINLRLIAPLSPHLIGRWFALLLQGRVLHSDIDQVASINHEIAIAIPMHYTIGITLGLVYLIACSALRLSPHSPVTAVGFALCTSLLPWLLMFPAMGYGWFGVHGPHGTRLFVSSLATHWFYGLGLWLGVSLMG